MPFQSEKQRRYMHANLPDIANRWEAKYGLGGIAELNSQLNSLPEYYMPFPAAQGGRIGYEDGTISPALKKRMLELLLQGVPPHKLKEEAEKQLKQDPYIKERMNIPGSPVVKEVAHGGLIPSHEAGIYGLAEGGSIAGGHQIGTPIGNRTGFGNPFGYSDAPAASSSSSSGDAGHLSHNVPVSLGGTKTTTTTGNGHRNIHQDTGKEEEAYVVVDGKKVHQTKWGTKDDPREQIQLKGDEDLETIAEIDLENARRKIKYDPNLTKNERENLEVGLGLRTPKKGKTIGNYAVSLLTTVLTGGIKNPLTSYAANKIIKYGADKIGLDDMITTFVDENIDFSNLSMDNVKLKIDQKKAEKDLIASLPKGHPERIQLEGLKKETITPDGPDGNGVETSITIDNIEEVNDDKTQLLKKYKEMDEASLLAWQRQQEMQAKKEAYLKNFRQMYMSAQGGRVPAGYNTGGLSNLFRLKNV